VSAESDRARWRNTQAHYNAAGKTRLNMALHHLEIGVAATHRADMTSQANELERVMDDLGGLLRSWPAPVRDQLERAS
jgi:hypothetical protein